MGVSRGGRYRGRTGGERMEADVFRGAGVLEKRSKGLVRARDR